MKTLNIATTILLVFVVSLRAQETAQDVVDAHNIARAAVGVAPLVWDETVANYARAYASQRQADCALEHSQGGPYGENLAKSTGELSGVAAVNMWVDEQVDYDYSSNTCVEGKMCGHYTQVVWRNSERVGCAKVICNDGGTFITCNYDPRGNYIGQLPY
ncbi:unnamed protein product [Cochlearia groenlandica]